MIGDLASHEIIFSKHYDLVALYVDEFEQNRCLPSSCLCPVEATPRAVTIHGFLARDFRRDASSGQLRPAPWLYTNTRKEQGAGYIGLNYPKSRNRNTDSGLKVMAARPSGMSGCPMLNGERLALGIVSVIGIFTDYCSERGMAYGESSRKLIKLLDGL